MEEVIKQVVVQLPMVGILLAIFWVMRGDVLTILARLEARIDRLIDALIDDDETQ